MANKRPTTITPDMRLRDFARSWVLEDLRHPELIVFIRLLAETAEQKTKRVRVINLKLYRDPRRAATALRELAERGLIKLHESADSRFNREIEVLQ